MTLKTEELDVSGIVASPSAGELIIIVEAVSMEQPLTAHGPGKVQVFAAERGAFLATGQSSLGSLKRQMMDDRGPARVVDSIEHK